MVPGDLLRHVARRNPNGTGIIYNGKSSTWKEVNERVNRVANALLALGLRKGDKVALFGQNSQAYAEVYYAVAKAGMVSVPLSWQSAPTEAAYILNDSEAKAIFIDGEYLPVVQSVASQLTTVKHILRIGEGDASVVEYECFLQTGAGSEPPVEVFPDDIRVLGYTSGTTGKPKGCIQTHGQTLSSLRNELIEMPIPRGEPTMLSVPLYTGFGHSRILLGLYNRGPVVILRKFQPQAFMEHVEKYKVGHTCIVPTMLIALVNFADFDKYDISSLKLIGYGGSVIAPVILKRAISMFKTCKFHQAFGAMESGGLVSFLGPEDHQLDGSELKEKRLLSTGREAQYAQIRIVDDKGNELGANERGEMIVRSASNFPGYWHMPEKTAETVKSGWIYTGDIAYKDEEGYIYIVDRKKEMIVSGGSNIYPAEVETVLCTHPAVAQAAVIGVPDDKWGEAVKAIIELKRGAKATEEELIEFCRQNLASYKKPKSVEFMASLPVSSSGKLDKKGLRERYWQGHERKI